MALIAQQVERGCQFLIATHSPILMALPGAVILAAKDARLTPMDWNDTEHVRVTRAFLNNPDATMKQLLSS
jgi:predicted ATPase